MTFWTASLCRVPTVSPAQRSLTTTASALLGAIPLITLTMWFVLAADGTLPVPDGPGIGVDPDPGRLEAATRRVERLEKE